MVAPRISMVGTRSWISNNSLLHGTSEEFRQGRGVSRNNIHKAGLVGSDVEEPRLCLENVSRIAVEHLTRRDTTTRVPPPPNSRREKTVLNKTN